jgi:sugar phosphate isomerase/epimerase
MTRQPTRRQLLQHLAGVSCLAWARTPGAAQETGVAPRRLFCLQTYSYSIRQRQDSAFGEPVAFMRFARDQGFAGLQVRIGERLSDDAVRRIRDAREQLQISLEGIVSAPLEERDGERLDAELRACQAAGIDVVRLALLTGRRYETFRSVEAFAQFKTRAEQALVRAARSAARLRMRVAVENHKDFRARELAELLRRLDSEFVGVCLDTGNNIALLEDPWHVVDTLAPWTFSVHIKDMAVEASADGFLLAEVPLGSGFLDLHRLVRRLHAARPQARFHLEMITRNPLSIPCLTDDYWQTLSEVAGIDLARTLQLVRRHARPANDLPRISQLDAREQVRVEQEHVVQSVRWAGERLFRG